jgi:large repetitive protein
MALLAAPAAQATFHLIKVREVYPGAANDSYVELQTYAAGQNFLTGHSLTVYDASGALAHKSTFSSSVANGQNQATVLVGDSGVQTSFGVAPDLVDAELAIPAAGGAACWNAGGIPADCVAWGSFNGGSAFETATATSAGSPASPGGVTAGKAIRRTIEPGCPTLLEEGDDTNSSLADFFEVAPAPRNNGSPIVETTCAGAPNTVIDEKPAIITNSTSAAFTYEAPTATGYECKLDAAAFAPCSSSGIEYTGLAEGTHSFQVRGFNASGPDPTPASYSWTVDTTPPTTVIDLHPDDPSPGGSASFAFHASETGSSFECSLSAGAAADSFSACSSGKTYTALADGEYTFKVRATDPAGNQQPVPTTFSWTVDNSLADTTPPQTKIDSFPPDPSPVSTASFTYESNEPGSSFECALDAAPFSPCAASGATYLGLANGPHSFQVRAMDPSANVDPTPAGYSWSVAVAGSAIVPAPLIQPAEPQTFLTKKPAARTRDRTPTFRFRSDTAGAHFQCQLDRGPYRRCRSPHTTRKLSLGRHSFAVRALVGSQIDPTPARFRFKVVGA